MNNRTRKIRTAHCIAAIDPDVQCAAAPGGKPDPASHHGNAIALGDVAVDFDALIGTALAAIADSDPVDDAVLGRYVQIASLVRSISFHEGKLLEQGLIRVAQANPDLIVLWQHVRLPIVPAALEALAGNDWEKLEGISFDADARTKRSYTPDLIIISRKQRSAVVIDLKRSLASYGDTNRLLDLKAKMMAAALVLPDWLYKEHKRLVVEDVGIAIVDGASRPSDHDQGIWALSEIDALLEIDGAAAAMAQLRSTFAKRVQALLEAEAWQALQLSRPILAMSNGEPNARPEKDKAGEVGSQTGNDCNGRELAQPPQRITVGFARLRLERLIA